VQIFFGGRRGRFTFGRNAEAAAEQARRIYKSLETVGWRQTLEDFSVRGSAREQRKESLAAEEAHEKAVGGRVEHPTVGDLIRIAGELSTVRPATLHGYAKALRFIVAEVFGITHTEDLPEKKSKHGRIIPARSKDLRHDYRGGGLKKWRAEVDSVQLERITPADLQRWRKDYLSRSGTDPGAVDHARVSFNKSLRNAKALCSRKIRPFIEARMILPRPLFFEGARFESEPPMRYQSKIDPAAILKDATENLSVKEPETFKALFLCLVLGLRRNEADTLLWSQIDFSRAEVTIEPTEYILLKSRDSGRVLSLDDTTSTILRGWHDKARGHFVLESRFKARPMARTPVYRCRETWAELAKWLRGKGITARKPIHELRKECGTLLLKQGQPIESVSRYLGHGTLQITMKHYADITKQRAAVDLGALMS
jgi:integrase